MIIDTHCHYNLEPLVGAWQDHWQRAQAAGVVAAVVVGTDADSSKLAIRLADENPHFVATVGFHPNHFQTPSQLSELRVLENLVTNKNVVAIGEIGLDYFRLSDSDEATQIKELRKRAFRSQLELAAKHSLPVCIHVRDSEDQAYFDVLQILASVERKQVPFILHCISGPINYIEEALQLGAYLGIAANSTYPKSTQIHAGIELAPIDRLLLETDAPFLPPQAYRGQVCEPWMISETAAALFAQKNISANQILSNTRAAFLDKIPL